MNGYFDALDGVGPDGPIDPAFDHAPFDTAMDGAGLIAALHEASDPAQAERMVVAVQGIGHAIGGAQAEEFLMFLGVPDDKRREIQRPYFERARGDSHVDWSFVAGAWAYPQREFQYAAVDYLIFMQDKLGAQDLDKIQTLLDAKPSPDLQARITPIFDALI